MNRNLKTEGIFRISPLALTVDVLKEAYDRGQKFIVWREGDAVLSFPHWKQGSGNAMVVELHQTEGYRLPAATGLLKLWYRALWEPIFPQSCYVQLETIFGDSEVPLEIPHIFELIAPISEWSFITVTSRLILTKHLLPLLSRVAELQDRNQMTPYNLSVCFAPTLIRGPDPVDDVKIGAIVRRLLEAAVTHWKTDLAAACGMEDPQFEESLRMPAAIEDREDDLEEAPPPPTAETSAGLNTIALIDNDLSDDDDEDEDPKPASPPRPDSSDDEHIRPTLPPRPRASTLNDAILSGLRRKPAPAVPTLPRYSVIMGDATVGTERLPTYEPLAPSGEAEPRHEVAIHDPVLPPSSSPEESAVARKPLPQPQETGRRWGS